MADDIVRNEVNAVRSLKTGITRYSQQIRAAVASARGDLRAAQSKAEDNLERRRKEVRRAEREVAEAQAAVARVHDERDYASAEKRIRVAMHWLAEAGGAADRAQRAVQAIASIQTELGGALQTAEHTVAQQSLVTSSALANLEAKLRELPHTDRGSGVRHVVAAGVAGSELPHTDRGSRVRHVVAGGVIFIELATASMNLGRMTSNALASAGINLPSRDTSITQMAENDLEEAKEYVVTSMAERDRRIQSGEDEETIA